MQTGNPVARRILAEVDAKRRILDAYAQWETANVYAGDEIRMEYNDTILPLLALPYADRPGYREEWKP